MVTTETFLCSALSALSDLELYFVIVNNEYGQQSEEESPSAERVMRVTAGRAASCRESDVCY